MVPSDQHDKTYLDYHQALFNMYGAYIFIGIFLGVLFLLAAGSIIFYKQLMEARDDKNRYVILKKIGMTKKEVLKSVRRQVAIVFFLPFSVAILHSLVILKTYKNMVYALSENEPVFTYALIVTGIYFIIYGLFYILSIKGYMRTIWRNDRCIRS